MILHSAYPFGKNVNLQKLDILAFAHIYLTSIRMAVSNVINNNIFIYLIAFRYDYCARIVYSIQM